ncbi:hypothetical protein [Amycolatopsis sp. NPDC052450]|uniref:hypothetical protein n=1 Tax=Amycolatopsis sp. NPDC052450 TaxID=3363937 RepID=UPI0037CC2276
MRTRMLRCRSKPISAPHDEVGDPLRYAQIEFLEYLQVVVQGDLAAIMGVEPTWKLPG